MAEQHQKIKQLEHKTQQLIAEYLRLQEKNIELQQRILTLERDRDALQLKNRTAAQKLRPIMQHLRKLTEVK